MARTLLDLAKSLERRAAVFSEAGNASKKRKVTAIIRYLAHITPVDTSKALSNWQLGIGSAPTFERPAFYAGSHGSTAQLSTETTINYALAQLQDVKPGTPVWVSNLVPYIGKLNE